jgi:phosphatidylserine decarboxylase
MVDRLAIQVLELLPKNTISRIAGALAELELPEPLQSTLNESVALAADIDRDESRKPPAAYESLNAFFTRRLKPSARPVEAESEGDVVMPVDGELSAFGDIRGGTMFQAKGRTYDLIDLLDSGAAARRFQSGRYATIYLSPSDYHRIHSPVAGRVAEASYIPGHLFPVHPFVVERVDELFAVNERLISFIETERWGRVGVVKVGATCVGRISLAFDSIETNRSFRRRRIERYDDVDVSPGDHIGIFNLGSTVVTLFESRDFQFRDDLERGQQVEMGDRMGRFVA